jgi:hypothetical protein
MIELLKEDGMLIVRPRTTVTADDFRAIAHAVDPDVRANGKLIEALSFTGWEDFGALIEHVRFVRDHHRKIDRVAAFTESKILTIAPKIAEHFAPPEFKVFRSGERSGALA